MFKDWSISAITAGFVAVLVSYSGPLMIFFQAAQSADVSNAMITSWVWAISLGAAVSGILLSLWLKVPVVTAWSAPGTALLVTLFPDLSLGEAVGAYLVAAAATFVIGVTGSFDRIIRLVPPGIASAMIHVKDVAATPSSAGTTSSGLSAGRSFRASSNNTTSRPADLVST